MASIEQYRVTQPPTSEGVYKRIVKALENRDDTFSLTLISTREVPKPQEQEFLVAVHNFMPKRDGTTVASGTWMGPDGLQPSIVIEMADAHSEAAATAHIVTADPLTV